MVLISAVHITFYFSTVTRIWAEGVTLICKETLLSKWTENFLYMWNSFFVNQCLSVYGDWWSCQISEVRVFSEIPFQTFQLAAVHCVFMCGALCSFIISDFLPVPFCHVCVRVRWSDSPCLFSLNDFYEIKNCIDNDHLNNVFSVIYRLHLVWCMGGWCCLVSRTTLPGFARQRWPSSPLPRFRSVSGTYPFSPACPWL